MSSEITEDITNEYDKDNNADPSDGFNVQLSLTPESNKIWLKFVLSGFYLD